ncbi:MAG: sugar ABC transporter substrate-binding protein [Butyrivibrio sp.]|nr:sugar ABC transporter substrate-binding protein [Butyrivibrio sp.]
MRKRSALAMLVSATMLAGSLAGCGGSSGGTSTPSDGGSTAKTEASTATSTDKPADTTAASTETPAADSGETMKLEIYDVAANYQGDQTGWFAKVLKDACNIEINIIAPQVAGDAIYQTRASAGDLGDILILEKDQWKDCVANGLIRDMTDGIDQITNLADYRKQIDVLNQGLDNNADGKIYGIPCQMLGTSPTEYSQETIYSSPLLRWDLYKAIGAPEIKDLEGLLDVLQEMKEKFPTNEAGDPAYPFSLWADWDGGDGMLGIANVVQLTTWYDQKIKGSIIQQPDGSFLPLTDKAAGYYRILHFLNEGYRRGLVDPDSGTQDWNSACAKMSNGQVYLFWYSWQTGFWNSLERQQNGTAMMFIPVQDQYYYTDGDAYYGDPRVWAIGSNVTDEEYARILEFLNWYASPDGLEFQHHGIKDFNYKVGDDGKYIPINDNALMDNLPVPEEYGGAGYNDGNNAINQWLLHSLTINPKTGEPYNSTYWASYKAQTMTDMKREWQEMFGAEDQVDYLKKNNKLAVSPNVSVALPSDSNDISVIRNQCSEALNDYSWRMIFVDDDATFDAMWDEMTEQLNGLGFEQLAADDTARYEIEYEAKKAALK